MRHARAVREAVALAIVVHVVLTILENSPDAKVALSGRVPFLRNLPQWRFFAPNPGVEDTHVLYRSQVVGGWSPWATFEVRNPLRWYSSLWNPKSRAPKAIFDIGQQLRMLGGFGASYDWARQSHAYLLLVDVLRDRCIDEGRTGDFQFMVVIARPDDPVDSLVPTIVSEPHPVTQKGSDEH